MAHALLVDRLGKTRFIRGGPIVNQGAGVIDADYLLQNEAASPSVDSITGGLITNPGVQPNGMPADAPTGFIRDDNFRFLERFLDFLVSGLESVGDAQDDLGAGAAAQGDAEQGLEVVGDFAVRESTVFIEIGDGGLGVGSDLAGGGARGITGLQAMPATHRFAAIFAAALVNDDFAANGLDGDFGLELFRDVLVFGDVAATIGTAIGQRGVEDLVDLCRLGWEPMPMFTMAGAGFSAIGFRIFLGCSFGKGGGLSLAGLRRLLGLSLELLVRRLQTIILFVEMFVLRLEFAEALLQVGDALSALVAIRARQKSHIASIGKKSLRSCASFANF